MSTQDHYNKSKQQICQRQDVCASVYAFYVNSDGEAVGPSQGTLLRQIGNGKCIKYTICVLVDCMVVIYFSSTLPDALNDVNQVSIPADAAGVSQICLSGCTCNATSPLCVSSLPILDPNAVDLCEFLHKGAYEGRSFVSAAWGPIVSAAVGNVLFDNVTGLALTTPLEIVFPPTEETNESNEKRICIAPASSSFEPPEPAPVALAGAGDGLNPVVSCQLGTNTVAYINANTNLVNFQTLNNSTPIPIIDTDFHIPVAFSNNDTILITMSPVNGFFGTDIINFPGMPQAFPLQGSQLGDTDLTVAPGLVLGPANIPNIIFSRTMGGDPGVQVGTVQNMSLNTNHYPGTQEGDLKAKLNIGAKKMGVIRTMGSEPGLYLGDFGEPLPPFLIQNTGTVSDFQWYSDSQGNDMIVAVDNTNNEVKVFDANDPENAKIIAKINSAVKTAKVTLQAITNSSNSNLRSKKERRATRRDLVNTKPAALLSFEAPAQKLAFVTLPDAKELPQLQLQPLHEIPGTEGVIDANFTPDGETIVGQAAGGGIVTLALGQTWNGQLAGDVTTTWLPLT